MKNPLAMVRRLTACACASIAVFVAPLRGQTNPNATGSPASSSVSALPNSIQPTGSSGNSANP
ncbi:MAG: hypothetical protein ACREIW_04130, partial [Chthoniobacterales bacterium]